MRSILKESNLISVEKILRCLPKFIEPENLEKSFIKMVTLTKGRNPSRVYEDVLRIFPTNVLNKYPIKSMNKFINCSFEETKSMEFLDVSMYNALIETYMKNDIDFDISCLLNDMAVRQVSHNKATCQLLIKLYCQRGDIMSAQNLVEKMKTEDMILSEKSKFYLYGGLIRAGKPEEAVKYLLELGVAENNYNVLKQRAYASADIGHFEDTLKAIRKIVEINGGVERSVIINVYYRSVKGGISDAKLNEILPFGNFDDNLGGIISLVFLLNRNHFYRHSLNLLWRYRDHMDKKYVITDLVLSFNTVDCPVKIYESVLKMFLDQVDVGVSHLFANWDFKEACEFTKHIINNNNSRLLISNMFQNAMRDKSMDRITKCLQLASEHMRPNNRNAMIQFTFVPALLGCDFVSSPQHLMELFPNHKEIIVSNMLMHFLAKIDFISFRRLIMDCPIKYFDYQHYSRQNISSILERTCFLDFEVVQAEASKVFSHYFVNWLLGQMIIERVDRLSHLRDKNSIHETLALGKRLGVSYSEYDLAYIEKLIPDHLDDFKEFQIFAIDKNAGARLA